MSELHDNARIFHLPPTRGWGDFAVGLLARVEALQPECVLDVRITDRHQEVAWVTIYRSPDDVITASGPNGPYLTRGQTTWTWHPAASEPPEFRNEREIERAEIIASSVLAFLLKLDAVPDAENFGMEGAVQFHTWSPRSGPAPSDYSWDNYAEHRTGLQVSNFLHYLHVIPVSKGFTKEHVDKHFPGWRWEDLVEVMKAADVFIGRGGSPATCRPTVKAIHFTDRSHWAVEWLDGTVTTSV